MTLAQTDPVRSATTDVSEDDVEGHVYAWYDPDAAAYELPDPRGDLDSLSDEDGVPDRA
jgi:hypothetical protein